MEAKTSDTISEMKEMKDRWKALLGFIYESITKLVYLFKDRK